MNSIDYFTLIEEQEKTSTSFCKIGDVSKKLIISFGHVAHVGFMCKKSLITRKIKNNSFDILYLRDERKQWYLGDLPNIGLNVSDTLKFLKKQTHAYNEIICIGASMGGYASLLYGSMLNANLVIAKNPQTDLDYVLNNTNFLNNLKLIKFNSKKIWNKYSNLKKILNKKTEYICCWLKEVENEKYSKKELALHGSYHYENIKSFKNVKNEIFNLSNLVLKKV